MAITAERKAQLDALIQQSKDSSSGITPERKAQLDQIIAQSKMPGQAEQKPGFLETLASPFTKAATTAQNVIRSVGDLGSAGIATISGDKAGAQKFVQQAGQDINAERSYGPLGKSYGIGQNQTTGEQMGTARGIADILGTGAEVASYGIGGGGGVNAAKAGLKGLLIDSAIQGSKTFATVGGLTSLGKGLQEGQYGTELVKNALKGTAGGAVAGAILGPATEALVHGVPAVARFGLAKASGLQPKTIETALTRGAELKAANVSRETIGTKAKNAFDNLGQKISDVGGAYNPIRTSGQTVSIPQGYWDKSLKNLGINLGSDGLVSREISRVMTGADKNAIDDFLTTYAKEGTVSADDFLRAREALANVAKYDAAKTTTSSLVSENLRADLNASFRNQIKGLEELDAAYSPLKNFLKEVRVAIDRDGNVKLSKVVNSLKKGNEAALATLEKLHPGITKDLEILSALEDIELAAGQKIGAYAQHILFSGGLGASISGIPGGFLGILISNPKIIIPILEHYSIGKDMLKSGLDHILKKILTGVKPNPEEAQIVSEAIQNAFQMSEQKLLPADRPGASSPEVLLHAPIQIESQAKSLPIAKVKKSTEKEIKRRF